MKCKCDHCDREATITEVTVRNGQKIEKHLCEDCARQEGIAFKSQSPINELITKFVMAHGQAIISAQAGSISAKASGQASCGFCGMSFAEFRQRGVLGCPECYKTFELQLGPLIERAHEGATHHVGKAPRKADLTATRAQRISLLRKQLADAIAAEQYEKAAALRDELLSAESRAPDAADPRITRAQMRAQPGAREAGSIDP